MATVYEYYKTDFWYAFSLEASFEAVNERGQKVAFEKSFMLDLNVNARFLALYLPSCSVELVISVLEQVRPLLTFANNVTLGNRIRAGTRMELQSQDDFVNVHYHGPGETDSFNADEFPFTGRVFIYSAASIADSEWARIKEAAQQRHFKVVYRGPEYAAERDRLEKPRAFVSHDFRDAEAIARPIAIRLRDMMCPVWYAEFSLQVGDSLRESIERGLKTCHMCIFVLTPNFLSKGGWPKREYDAIFTRELLEKRQLILPVWAGSAKRKFSIIAPSWPVALP